MPTLTLTAEEACSPNDPRLTAYEAGRWYALNGCSLPGGAAHDAARGYADAMDEQAEVTP